MNDMIEIHSPLGSGLLLRQMSGEESLGRLFEYRVELQSPKGELDPDDLLGKSVTIKLEQPDGGERCFNGHVARVEQTGHDGRYFTSHAVLRPWLWFLTRRTDCRIHQELTVPEILKLVFDEYADIAVVDFRLTGEYRKWEYCVQYRESDFNFVSRLMEHEGIYYFFEHSATQHKLVLVDSFNAHKDTPGFEKVPYYAEGERARSGVEFVQQWRHAQEMRSGQFSTRDYDFKLPSKAVQATKLNASPPGLAEVEVYDYPGGYIESNHGEHYAEVRLGELQTGHESSSGTGSVRTLFAGSTFGLTQHPTAKRNTQYLVTRTTIQASLAHHESGGDPASFACSFSVVPARQQFRPRRSTTKPIVQGPQTAVIVGADGDEIYVDSFGRVKVKFHWDRHEPKDNKEENRSCWIRVSQAMAGKNWGFVAIPRVKQEVIVDFLEGDPDQPIITGRVYNGEQMPPYDLPGNATQSGLKTRSSKGGSPANYNEIRFEDKKGSEQVYIHAEKDKSIHVENDDSTFVGHDQSITVRNDQTSTVTRDQKLTVTHDRSVHVENDESHLIDKVQKIKVGTNRSVEVGGNQNTSVTGDRITTITGNETSTTAKVRLDVTGMDHIAKVTGNQNIDVTGNLDYKAKRMVFEAEHIEHIVTGAHSHKTESPNGPYEIFAKEFTVQSSTNATIFAAGDINQICMKNNVTTMGPSESSLMSMATSVKLGMTSDTFLGVKMSTSVSLESTTSISASSTLSLGAKLDSSIGPSLAFRTMQAYLPPGGAAAGGALPGAKVGEALVAGVKAAKALSAVNQILPFIGVLTSIVTPIEDINKKKADKAEAKSKALDAARRAFDAGHPALALRMFWLAGGSALVDTRLATGSTDALPESLKPLVDYAIDSARMTPGVAEQAKVVEADPAAPQPTPVPVTMPDQKPPANDDYVIEDDPAPAPPSDDSKPTP